MNTQFRGNLARLQCFLWFGERLSEKLFFKNGFFNLSESILYNICINGFSFQNDWFAIFNNL